MVEFKKFSLSDNFIDGYKRKRAPFGFNGLGELVYMRTYSRIKEDGKKFHARSLNQKEKPYGRELKRRWENKDGHDWWDSVEDDMYFVDTKPKNIYVYPLNKKQRKRMMNDIYNCSSNKN